MREVVTGCVRSNSGAQAGINFTRAHEIEADRVGLPILAGAGFDPRSMPAFFEQLQQATRFYESGAPELLRTHPVTTSRIADTRARAEQYPRVKNTDTLSYLLTRAKLRVLTSNDPVQPVEYFTKTPRGKTPDQEAARRYGDALKLYPRDYALTTAYARELLLAGQPVPARQALQDYLRTREPRPLVYK